MAVPAILAEAISPRADLPAGGWVLAVADGMGGHNAGDVASQMIVDSIATSFKDKKIEEIRKRLGLQKMGFLV